MNAAEIVQRIDKMTEEERFFAAAYIQHLAQERDPSYPAVLSARMKKMDEGKKISLEQVQRIHETLENEGL